MFIHSLINSSLTLLIWGRLEIFLTESSSYQGVFIQISIYPYMFSLVFKEKIVL